MFLPAVYIALALAGLAYFLTMKREYALSPLTMYFLGTVVFLFPGAITRTAVLWHVEESTEWTALSVLVVSTVVVILGSVVGRTLFRKRRPRASKTIEDVRISSTVLTLVLVASVLTKLYFDPDTFVAKIIMEVERSRDVFGKYLEVLSSLPTALACLVPWLWERARNRSLYSAVIVGLILVTGVFSLSRTPIFYVLGTLGLYVIWKTPKLWNHRSLRLAFLVVILALVPFLTFFAAFIKGTNKMVDAAERQDAVEYTQAYDFAIENQYDLAVSDAYGNFLFILDNYPKTYDYMPGLSIEVLATTVIPRSSAPWKPWSPSYHITNQILGDATYETQGSSLVTSFLGEIWMNGGWAAIIIGSLVLGILAQLFWRIAKGSNEPGFKTVLYIMSLILFFFMQRGDLISTFFRGMVYVALAFFSARIIIYFSNRRSALSTASNRRHHHGHPRAATLPSGTPSR